LKILHFITSLKIGGAETMLYNLLSHWKEKGDTNEHIVLYIHDGPYVEKIKNLEIPVHKVRGFFVGGGTFYELAKIVKKIKPDVIHSSLWSANLSARIVASIYKVPVICDLHGNYEFYGFLRNFLEKISFKLLPKTVKTKFVSVSNSIDFSFKKRFGKFDAIIIKNGIDVCKIRKKANCGRLKKEDLSLKKDDFIFGAVGRLCKIKRYDLLIKAFFLFLKNVSNRARLVIVGDGPERANLESLSKALKINPHVIFVGQQENPYRYYPIFDCFVISSDSEGMSVALLEALSFGLPIVTTCQGEKHDVITDGVNGFVLSINNVNKRNSSQLLFDSFRKIYENKELANSMRKENIELVKKNYSIEIVANKYFSLYKDFGGCSH
jgi:glycosyltransferase involved in cell wall biosynthesis